VLVELCRLSGSLHCSWQVTTGSVHSAQAQWLTGSTELTLQNVSCSTVMLGDDYITGSVYQFLEQFGPCVVSTSNALRNCSGYTEMVEGESNNS